MLTKAERDEMRANAAAHHGASEIDCPRAIAPDRPCHCGGEETLSLLDALDETERERTMPTAAEITAIAERCIDTSRGHTDYADVRAAIHEALAKVTPR